MTWVFVRESAWQFALTLLVYFAMMLAYSKWLKRILILDVLVLAAGFVLRVHAGTTLIIVERFSPWLYVLMTLLALYLGFGKRRAELAERRIATAEAQAAADVKAAAADLATHLAEQVLTARLAKSKSDPLVDAALAQLPSKLN